MSICFWVQEMSTLTKVSENSQRNWRTQRHGYLFHYRFYSVTLEYIWWIKKMQESTGLSVSLSLMFVKPRNFEFIWFIMSRQCEDTRAEFLSSDEYSRQHVCLHWRNRKQPAWLLSWEWVRIVWPSSCQHKISCCEWQKNISKSCYEHQQYCRLYEKDPSTEKCFVSICAMVTHTGHVLTWATKYQISIRTKIPITTVDSLSWAAIVTWHSRDYRRRRHFSYMYGPLETEAKCPWVHTRIFSYE